MRPVPFHTIAHCKYDPITSQNHTSSNQNQSGTRPSNSISNLKVKERKIEKMPTMYLPAHHKTNNIRPSTIKYTKKNCHNTNAICWY